MKKIILLIGFILPLQIFAQVWVARYDGPAHNANGAYAMAVDDSGYIYITGTRSLSENGSSFIYLTS
jgi:hypothetical protein